MSERLYCRTFSIFLLILLLYITYGFGERSGREAGYREGFHSAPEFVAYQQERIAREKDEAIEKQASFPDAASTCDEMVLLFVDQRPIDADSRCDQVRDIIINDLEDDHLSYQ